MIERGQEETAESAFSGVGVRQPALLDDPREKRLGQILSFFHRLPAASDIGVDRIPVRATQFLHCRGWLE